MGKVNLEFIDYSDDERRLKIVKDRKTVQLEVFDTCTKHSISVFLDKSTAIKAAKTLRTEINKISESEVTDG